MQLNEDRLAKIMDISLREGSHSSFGEGACVMELVSWLAGEPWSDHPECACPVITAFMVAWNDGLPSDEERDRLLKPLVPRIVGTRGSRALENCRSMMAADWLIRTHAPAWLRLAGLTAQADALAGLPEITDMAQVPSIRPVIETVRDDAAAARAAAGDAAGAAAWDAARAAAGAAAWDALKPTKIELQANALALVERMIAAKDEPEQQAA